MWGKKEICSYILNICILIVKNNVYYGWCLLNVCFENYIYFEFENKICYNFICDVLLVNKEIC